MTEAPPPNRYEAIAVSGESTVVAEYQQEAAGPNDAGYQSEADLEAALVGQLRGQAYEHLTIGSEADLIANLRRQLERLNGIEFSQAEWERFFTTCVAAEGSGAANPAFDVTPARLVTGLITERGRCDASAEGLAGLYPERG